MVEEKVYELDDGTELILVENVIIDNRRYLLLSNENDDKIRVAYEENRELVFINENDVNFNDILLALFGKIKKLIQDEN